jgi:hypothetical protein
VDYRLATTDDLKDVAAKGVELQAHRTERERLAAEKQKEDAARLAEAERMRQAALNTLAPIAPKTRKGNASEVAQAGSGKSVVVAAGSVALDKLPVERAGSGGAQARPGGGTLTFIVYQALQPGMKARRNGHCYSNVITVPGPPGFQTGKGWGGSETGAVDKAIAMVKAYFDEFRQKCNQSVDGQRHMRVEGTTLYDFNTLAEPDRVQRAYSRFKSFGGDMVEVQLAPR